MKLCFLCSYLVYCKRSVDIVVWQVYSIIPLVWMGNYITVRREIQLHSRLHHKDHPPKTSHQISTTHTLHYTGLYWVLSTPVGLFELEKLRPSRRDHQGRNQTWKDGRKAAWTYSPPGLTLQLHPVLSPSRV